MRFDKVDAVHKAVDDANAVVLRLQAEIVDEVLEWHECGEENKTHLLHDLAKQYRAAKDDLIAAKLVRKTVCRW